MIEIVLIATIIFIIILAVTLWGAVFFVERRSSSWAENLLSSKGIKRTEFDEIKKHLQRMEARSNVRYEELCNELLDHAKKFKRKNKGRNCRPKP